MRFVNMESDVLGMCRMIGQRKNAGDSFDAMPIPCLGD